MPKVTTYRCSRCSYKSKDKTKVEKHIRLHNVFAQRKDLEERSRSPVSNCEISVGSSQKSISQPSKSDPTGVSPASEVEHEQSVNSCVEETETEPEFPSGNQSESQLESQSELQFENLANAQKKSISKLESKSEFSTKSLSSQSGSPTKNSPSISPGKLSRSNLSRTRPLDASVFPLAKTPIKRTKSNDTQLNDTQTVQDEKSSMETSTSATNDQQTQSPNVSKASVIGGVSHPACLTSVIGGVSHPACHTQTFSQALPLTQLEVKRESLEEIRFRYYIDRMKVKEETVQVKDEVLDGEHPKQPTMLASIPLYVQVPSSGSIPEPSPASASKSNYSIEWANWRRSVLGTAYPKVGSSKNGRKKTKGSISKRRAKILVDTICSDEEHGEIIPELVSEEQAEIIPQVVYEGCSFPEKLTKRSRIEEGPASKSGILLDKVGYLKKLDTGNVSCKINQDTVTSFKKGLLESVISDSSGNILDKTATILDETKQLLGKITNTETDLSPNVPPISSHIVNTAPLTSQAWTTPCNRVEVCSARLVPLSQPPLVAPLTVPVTDLLTVNSQNILNTNNVNLMNIPVISQPAHVLVMSHTHRQSNLAVMSLDRSHDAVLQHVSPSTPHSKSDNVDNSISPKTVQSSKEKTDIETSSSITVSPKSDETNQHTLPIASQLLKEEIDDQATSSNSSQSKSESAKCSGLIMPPNNAIASCSSTDPSYLDCNPNIVQSQAGAGSSRSSVLCGNANKPSQPIGNIIKPPQTWIPILNKPSQPTIKFNIGKPSQHKTTIDFDKPSQSMKQAVHNSEPSTDPDRLLSSENSGNSSESDRVSTSEEINDIKSMLRDVTKMINDTSSLVDKITEKVTKLESKLESKY